ncbi:hypothetical protein [Bifidobacterium aquikefiri]|uniref:Uncharacterized protein n=1 Tax=Bifidobacterium aquikefiri TaxID=1653207 RepID=A0A261G8Q5_9BIFI|nr:hypothetical protein [Bifidobacterium aquikefiri]OZG67784.1 hypothetical protein BAQU_0428 [Bifidobacterium aquikefiri]
MTFVMKDTDIARVALLQPIRDAAGAGARLLELWPLQTALAMDNDAKYTEDLQVRVTREIARLLTGEDVTIADAEFVYEGATSIPGRPQPIVDATLAANEAYENITEYSTTADTQLVMASAGDLGVGWSEDQIEKVAEAVETISTYLTPDGKPLEAVASLEAVSQRLASALVAFCGMVQLLDISDDKGSQKALPCVLFLSELNERLGLPQVFVSERELREFVKILDNSKQKAVETAQYLAPLIEAEWENHRDKVLWDPDQAKKDAKAEDERKNKAALAAKFAHVKDDETKKPVEL